MVGILLGAILTTAGANGVDLTIEGESTQVDPAKSLFLTVTLKTPRGVVATLPDLRERVVGFSLAEDFAEEPKTEPDGSTVQVANWRLVPEPAAETYKLKPMALTPYRGASSPAAGNNPPPPSILVPPVYFTPPAAREPVTGAMETNPTRDLPPLSWKLVGWVALALLAVALLVVGCWLLVRFLAQKVKEHRMSPIERAWIELDRLLKKGLPGRGRYKDFYVELTMVVRRYVQRKYGIKAPNLTTEEFLREAGKSLTESGGDLAPDALKRFLESADLIKFAGVEATPEMADEATDSARSYLKDDSKDVGRRMSDVGGGQS